LTNQQTGGVSCVDVCSCISTPSTPTVSLTLNVEGLSLLGGKFSPEVAVVAKKMGFEIEPFTHETTEQPELGPQNLGTLSNIEIIEPNKKD
jgi:hypothetical protein